MSNTPNNDTKSDNQASEVECKDLLAEIIKMREDSQELLDTCNESKKRVFGMTKWHYRAEVIEVTIKQLDEIIANA